jgi:hypothetical protein
MNPVAGLHANPAKEKLHADQPSFIRLGAILLVRIEHLGKILILLDFPGLMCLVAVVDQVFFVFDIQFSPRDFLTISSSSRIFILLVLVGVQQI